MRRIILTTELKHTVSAIRPDVGACEEVSGGHHAESGRRSEAAGISAGMFHLGRLIRKDFISRSGPLITGIPESTFTGAGENYISGAEKRRSTISVPLLERGIGDSEELLGGEEERVRGSKVVGIGLILVASAGLQVRELDGEILRGSCFSCF